MTIIRCNNPCLYQNEGNCTLTHVTSVSQPSHYSCAYFKDKTEKIVQENSKLL